MNLSLRFCPIAAMAAILVLPLLGPRNAAEAADANVNTASVKQVIDGFGASSAWSGAMSDKIFNGLYTDLGFSILRLRIEEGIGDNWKTGNFNSWSSELSNSKKAKARGAIVFASPWNPPKSMQENFTKTGDASAQRLRYDKYQEYVDYLNAYVKYMKDNGGELHAISVQNEPDYAKDWNWWTPTEMVNFMKNYAGKINSKVIAPESFQFLKNMSDPILNDATALENMDILGFHLYGTPVREFAYPLFEQKARPLGKKLWQTEHFLGDNATITMSNVMTIAKEIHDGMVTGGWNAYIYWWIPHANGLTSTAGDIYKRAYSIGHFSKHVRPGYYRVDATANPSSNVFVSAYTGTNKVVIVALNTGTSAVQQKFNIQNASVAEFASWQTTANTSMAASSTAKVEGNSFTANLPGESITTFLGTNTSISVGERGITSREFDAVPTSRGIVVTLRSGVGKYEVSLLTVDGRLLASHRDRTGITALPVEGKGTYLVVVESEGHSLSKLVPMF
jgi:glucuronoarabinoxylan endo-1,4-beta-xylanase